MLLPRFASTAMKEATKLREWLVAVEPDYLQDTIKDVDALLAELASDQDRFAALLEVEPDPCRMRSRMSMLCSRTFSQKDGRGVQRKATTYRLKWMAETEDRACRPGSRLSSPHPARKSRWRPGRKSP